MLGLSRLRLHTFTFHRNGISNPIFCNPYAQFKSKRAIDAIVVKDKDSFASAIVSLLKQSEVAEKCIALKEMRKNPKLDPKTMGTLLKANDRHSNWFKQWVENAINGSYSKMFPINIPIKHEELLAVKAKFAATLFTLRSGRTDFDFAQWTDDIPEDNSVNTEASILNAEHKELYLQASEIVDILGNDIQVNRLQSLLDIFSTYSSYDFLSTDTFLKQVQSVTGYFFDCCVPALEFLNIHLSAEIKVLIHLQKEKRQLMIKELTGDIELLSSRNSSRVSSSEEISTTTTVAATAAPTPATKKTKKCLKTNGSVFRFDFRMKCYSLTQADTHLDNFHSVLAKTRSIYDPHYANASDLMFRVNKDYTSSSSSILDLIDGPQVNLSTRKSTIEKQTELIEQKLKKIEHDHNTVSDVESSLVGNIPTFSLRDDSLLMKRRVIIDNLPDDISDIAIHKALSRCGGVEEVNLFLLNKDRRKMTSYVPLELTYSRQELEDHKRQEEAILKAEEQKRALAELPDEYYKNGKLKPKKVTKAKKSDITSTRFPMRKRLLLDEEKTGNYAILTMEDNDSLANVTRAAIKLFGISIYGHLCKVTPVNNLKSFVVEVGEQQDVRTVARTINEILDGQFECHISSKEEMVYTSKPLYVQLDFDSHADGWSAFQKLYIAHKEGQAIYPSWVKDHMYHKMFSKAMTQKTFIDIIVPKDEQQLQQQQATTAGAAESEVNTKVNKEAASESDKKTKGKAKSSKSDMTELDHLELLDQDDSDHHVVETETDSDKILPLDDSNDISAEVLRLNQQYLLSMGEKI